MVRMRVVSAPIDIEALRDELADRRCGGYCGFEGRVRDHNAGAAVDALDYEAYAELAVSEGEAIIAEAMNRFDVVDVRCVHRVGALALGDVAIYIGVAAAHRDAAFRACRYVIDEAKRRLPVWKKEHYRERDPVWIDARDELARPDDGPGDRRTIAAADDYRPDHSRQMRLPGFGAVGQSRLAQARVLVVGAGGLGVPVLTYLAGAGVARIGIVDPDRVEASNLHRQVLYGAGDIGRSKVEVAAGRLAAQHPGLGIEVLPRRLDADSIESVFARYDLVMECTDSIASKYLCSDAAVLTGTPIVFASIYQYEGQVHGWWPGGRSSCLRCLWPQPPDPAAVGTCADGGVLGPVPGVLGAIQAIEAIKHLAGLDGRLDGELLLVNLLDYGMRRLATRPCSGRANGEACVRDLDHWRERGPALEQDYRDLRTAVLEGWQLVDIRNADELEHTPMPVAGRWLPLPEFLEGALDLGPGRHLLVCAHGQRSLYLARLLRSRGQAAVASLRGGLAGLGIGD